MTTYVTDEVYVNEVDSGRTVTVVSMSGHWSLLMTYAVSLMSSLNERLTNRSRLEITPGTDNGQVHEV